MLDETQIYFYYKNNAENLREVIDKIMKRFPKETDIEEYYSLADEIFCKEIIPKYDPSKGNLADFVRHTMYRKICTQITTKNRQKRIPHGKDREGKVYELESRSLDDERFTERGYHITETIRDATDYFESIFGEVQDKTELYLEKLPKLERKVIELLSSGYDPMDIRKILGISQATYNSCLQVIKATEYISILF